MVQNTTKETTNYNRQKGSAEMIQETTKMTRTKKNTNYDRSEDSAEMIEDNTKNGTQQMIPPSMTDRIEETWKMVTNKKNRYQKNITIITKLIKQ